MEMRARIPGKRQCSQFQDGAEDKRIFIHTTSGLHDELIFKNELNESKQKRLG